jgi:hypothetical protein
MIWSFVLIIRGICRKKAFKILFCDSRNRLEFRLPFDWPSVILELAVFGGSHGSNQYSTQAQAPFCVA